jgi:hypothetical protein
VTKTYAEHLESTVQALRQELAEQHALREKLADILSRTAVALRGPEPPLTRWSWHDLPELAAAAKSTAWQPIETAPEDMTELVVVRWVDREGQEQHEFDYREDGCWMGWHDHAEHVQMIGGHGVSEAPPYEQWLQLPPPAKNPGMEPA